MKRNVIKVNGIKDISTECGTKAETLKVLSDNGINVPILYSVDVSTFLNAYKVKDLDKFYSRRKYHHVTPPKVKLEIVGLENDNSSYMARSSVVPLERYDDDFASAISGAYESVYAEKKEDLPEAILSVWQSAFSEKAYNQIKIFDGKYRIKGMSVIIQQYIQPVISGLFHTKDDKGIDVNWIEGHLSDLVSGKKRGNNISCYLNENGECILSGVEENVMTIANSDYVSAFQKLLSCSLNIRELFPYHIEVEWLYDGNDIWIVQSQKLI